ncbi:MAG: QueT transporter family protein [Bacillota bacterium]
MTPRNVARVAAIAAVYAALTMLMAPISYGPVQVRVSELLTVLPYFTPLATPGLFLGCLLANVFGGMALGWATGLWIFDVTLGSLATLLAAYLTGLTRRRGLSLLAPLPPVLINPLIVGSYLQQIFGNNYWLTVGYIFVGQVVACYILGLPLLLLIRRHAKLRAIVAGIPEGEG